MAGKMAAMVAEVHRASLELRETLAAEAIEAGHDLADLVWEHRDARALVGDVSTLERWDLWCGADRWLGGVEVVRDGYAIAVRRAAGLATSAPADGA